MSLKLKFAKQNYDANCVVFYDDNIDALGLNKYFSKIIIDQIKDFILINKKSLNKNNKDHNKPIIFSTSPKQKIILFEINRKIKISPLDLQNFGGKFYNFIKSNSIYHLNILDDNLKKFTTNNNLINWFILGMQLKSYEFNKYKTKFLNEEFNIFLSKNLKNFFVNKKSKFFSLAQGVNLTKDLVSEPGNILFPEEYTKRILQLKKYGLKIKTYNENQLKKLGMNALLGVGQGSVRRSYLVTMEWNGSKKKEKPLAFVGKGVCFDTGGISLKPAKFMEDMTYDMAGSAVVVGLMKTLALRKAKVNAVGVVGLVENMPDGNAQRPGDIVKSYSGKTIEILNTDAEGRLVLADALSYTERKFKPKFIVDLATLTGAIIVSLGSEYAGLFSNDDKISDQLSKAGEKVGEKVWRMPLNENYDKLIDSKKADMQNINYVGGAGSTTAAQFLQRFIMNKTPWAHLDIAGMAFSKYGGALNSGGATGYGVRLLNQLIEDNYE